MTARRSKFMPSLLTNYHIKLLAALLMLIDHVGLVFFPQVLGFRLIGRLSFPLFGWLLVQGERHTRNIKRYALRLLGLGLISQPIYMMLFEVQRPNILFTLLLGLVCLRLARTFSRWEIPIWVGGALLAVAADLEYSSYGVILIALIGNFKPNGLWWASWIGLHLLTAIVWTNFGGFQFLAGFTPLLWGLANHQQGMKARWFYWFYPLHLWVLFLLR